MEDKIDIELLEQKATKIPMDDKNKNYFYQWTFYENDSTKIEIAGDKINGFFKWEYLPKPSFIKIYSEYYPNGLLKIKGKWIANTRIGIWDCYDHKGIKVEEVNMELEFGSFDYNKVLKFLHEKKHISLETGENRERLFMNFDEEKKIWSISITNLFFKVTRYEINGETGVVISTSTMQGGKE